MSEQEPEMGKWDQNPSEPREPFLPDEMFEFKNEGEIPSLEGLHIPKKPLTHEGLKGFLIELKPLVEDILHLSRQDQHKLGSYLQDIKKDMELGDFSEEIMGAFEKVAVHFSSLLVHSAPIDQEAVLKDINNAESML